MVKLGPLAFQRLKSLPDGCGRGLGSLFPPPSTKSTKVQYIWEKKVDMKRGAAANRSARRGNGVRHPHRRGCGGTGTGYGERTRATPAVKPTPHTENTAFGDGGPRVAASQRVGTPGKRGAGFPPWCVKQQGRGKRVAFFVAKCFIFIQTEACRLTKLDQPWSSLVPWRSSA